MFAEYSRASGSSVGRNSTVQTPVFLILSVRLEIVFALVPRSSGSLLESWFKTRPGPCKYNVSLYAIFLSRR